MEGSAYRAEADRFRLATMPVPAVRGSITSADGTTLAMTVQTDLVHADPPMIAQARRSLGSVASALARLGMTSASILALLSHDCRYRRTTWCGSRVSRRPRRPGSARSTSRASR